MKTIPPDFTFDIAVIGAGHAGCEAALASARLGMRVLLLATCMETIALCACNPSIGGTAKGQIVREIDALGGQMALCADASLLQMRMLNKSKGRAVYSPRAQVDKHAYHVNMKRTLESEPNIFLRQAEVVSAEPVTNRVSDSASPAPLFCVRTAVGLEYSCRAVIFCCGVYLNARTIVGEHVSVSGPSGHSAALRLSASIEKLGFSLRRFKTGTPARVRGRSIDFSKTTVEPGEPERFFSYMSDARVMPQTQTPCYLTYSTALTKSLILKHKHLAPIYNGGILGVGPRYCPSIEDKVIRFADKLRHQVFIEPEGAGTDEYYIQGASSSMPADVQLEIYRSIIGLERVEIVRDAYAIEYDCIDATALSKTLEAKCVPGVYFAGQICGTSGYEEAAAQGLVAGVNAALKLLGKQPFILTRENSYIGVLIDDITTKETAEPYRMMTGRAEHRLVLRQDNADLRLTELGAEIGLVSNARLARLRKKQSELCAGRARLNAVCKPRDVESLFAQRVEPMPKAGITVRDVLRRDGISAEDVKRALHEFEGLSAEVLEQIEIECKYEGYIERELLQIKRAERMNEKLLPEDIDYAQIGGLRLEAQAKLNKIRPHDLGQAGRISGVSPADIQVLLVYLTKSGEK